MKKIADEALSFTQSNPKSLAAKFVWLGIQEMSWRGLKDNLRRVSLMCRSPNGLQ
eukprot:gene2322-23860_t